MSRLVSPSTRRAYGILRVARLWGTSRAMLYRQRRCDQPGPGDDLVRSDRCRTQRWSRR